MLIEYPPLVQLTKLVTALSPLPVGGCGMILLICARVFKARTLVTLLFHRFMWWSPLEVVKKYIQNQRG